MNKLTAEKCREQFEAHIRNLDGDYNLIRVGEVYIDVETQIEWRTWQAAWKGALEIALPILEQQEQGEGEWTHWNGEMALPPVDSHVRVEVRRRNGGVNQRQAQDFAWRNQPVKSGTDIIAYRIIPEQPTNQNGEQ